MPINMSGFNVIYKGLIYNCLSINPILNVDYDDTDNLSVVSVDVITVIYVNSDNRISVIEDKANEFQFISK